MGDLTFELELDESQFKNEDVLTPNLTSETIDMFPSSKRDFESGHHTKKSAVDNSFPVCSVKRKKNEPNYLLKNEITLRDSLNLVSKRTEKGTYSQNLL
jgi:hypothetical protein